MSILINLEKVYQGRELDERYGLDTTSIRTCPRSGYPCQDCRFYCKKHEAAVNTSKEGGE